MAINIKPSHRGLLHKNLGVPQGEKIPASKLQVHEGDSAALKKRKIFAQNAKKWKHAEGGRVLPKYATAGVVDKVPFSKTNTGIGIGIAGSVVPMVTSLLPKDNYTDVEGNSLGSVNSMGEDVLSNAATGASMGMALGPIGAAVGAVGGAGYGFITNNMQSNDMKQKQRTINQNIANKNMTANLTTNVNQSTKQTYDNNNMVFANGGMVNINSDVPNATEEVEGGESAVTPDGQHIQFNGPSHENGGIETNLPEETFIFSDRLKMGKRTFASLAKPIQNRIVKAEDRTDKFSNNTKKLLEMQLKHLAENQEAQKTEEDNKRSFAKGGLVKYSGIEKHSSFTPVLPRNPGYNLSNFTAPNQPTIPNINRDNISKVKTSNFDPNWNELGQVGTSVLSNVLQTNRISNAASPRTLNPVSLTSQGTPRYINLSGQRGAISRTARSLSDTAGRSFGNSAAIQAFKNKARLDELQGLGESYQNQENINADIYGKDLNMRNDMYTKQQLTNAGIAEQNASNTYADAMARLGAKNAATADLAGNVSQMFGNRSKYANQLAEAGIYANAREKTVQNQMLEGSPQQLELFRKASPVDQAAINVQRVKEGKLPLKAYGGIIKKRTLKSKK